MDFQTQAQFFLNPSMDVRFLFRSILHQRPITDDYDIVIFDCPPRLTTSAINALTSSDYILIPSTFMFLNGLRTIAQPNILGIVANEVQFWRRPKLLRAHEDGMNKLKQLV